MDPHAHPPIEEVSIDEVVDETFPASDAPAWSTIHVGGPAPRLPTVEHGHEALRAHLRSDMDRLTAPFPDAVHRRRGRESIVSRAMLEAGRAVVREPIDRTLEVRTVESEQFGDVRDASCVILGARYDTEDVSGVATLLAVGRAIATVRLKRSVRFVAFADAPSASGSAHYAERMWLGGVGVRAMISLARLDLTRDHDASLFLVGNFRSRFLIREAAAAFRHASRLGVHALPLPTWLPGMRSSDQTAFWERGWPAMMIADRSPWRMRSSSPPDVDRIAAAVPGIVALTARLAERAL